MRRQRDKWVVRVDGIDTATGKHRPRQLGTYSSGVPKLSSHGLRHTAATQMVASAEHLGDLRAVADLLGHSPEVLMKIYAHAMPNHTASVVDRLRSRP